MLKKHHILTLLFFTFSSFYAQQEFGKSFVDVFASDEFYGRGYVNNGNKKAANYVAEQFVRFGLQPMRSSYFQEFSLDVNTFPEKTVVKFANDTLMPGVDYLVDPLSGSSNGSFFAYRIHRNNLHHLSKIDERCVVVLDPVGLSNPDSIQLFQMLKYQLAEKLPVIYLTESKLTWSVGTEATTHAIINISRSSFDFDSEMISLNIKNKYIVHYPTQNVIGKIEGRKKKKFIVISAHYDHLGMMGDVVFNGANDNASGVATMLYLASYFGDFKPKYSIVFIAFGGEEVGLKGSEHYIKNPLFPLKDIKFLINLDLNGTGEEGATVVNATLHEKEFKKLTHINSKEGLLSKIKMRGPAANSDHYWFTQKGVPAFFLYTLGGVTHYHDIYDRPETLPLTEFDDLSKLLIEFVKCF